MKIDKTSGKKYPTFKILDIGKRLLWESKDGRFWTPDKYSRTNS